MGKDQKYKEANNQPEKPSAIEIEGPEHNGSGFYDYENLMEIVTKYQQRKNIEEVQYLEEIGGTSSLLKELDTNLQAGIKKDSIEKRVKAFGDNHPPMIVPKSFISLFCAALNDFTLIILMVAAVKSIVIKMITEPDKRETAWIEGFVIIAAVLICSLVQSINDYQKARQFQKLNAEAEGKKTATVFRDGEEKKIKLGEILVGDIVRIISGMEIAGDGLVLNGSSISADESSMTGETDPMIKESFEDCQILMNSALKDSAPSDIHAHDIPSPVLLGGTKILNGSGLMLVITVGRYSSIGKIRDKITTSQEDTTPLQRKLEGIAFDMGLYGLVMAVLVFLFQIGRTFYHFYEDRKWTSDQTDDVVEAFLVSITVLVVAIPEGLPLAVTLSLAFSIKKMMKDNNLVRKLHACETMGSANVICSDKTGTLTQNKMVLTHFWNIKPYEVYIQQSDQTHRMVHFKDFVSHQCRDLITQTICCNSDADPVTKDGNPTELAMLNYMGECGVDVFEIREEFPKLAEEPFSSSRKRMSTYIQVSEGKNLMVIKGASELILRSCESVVDLKTGDVKEIDEKEREKIESAILKFAKMSLRTIGLAYSRPAAYDRTRKNDKGVLDVETSGLTLVGICGIQDIVRSEVPNAVLTCQKAGIQVKMVTGDNKITAEAIAKDVHILDKNKPIYENYVMEGPEFLELVGGICCKNCKENGVGDPDKNCVCVKPSDQDLPENKGKKVRIDTIKNGKAFDKIWNDLAVLARSRPEDKYALVVGLRERNMVVAVTGDGTNDAPALAKANVGFAMGISGTEVARQTADILLMDDNFNSIIKAVMWGRNIFDSIQKFLQFQLTANVAAVVITFITVIAVGQSYLSAVQMLWVRFF